MEISTDEAWEAEEQRGQQRLAIAHPEQLQYHADLQRALNRQRAELLRCFPYTVVAAGAYPEHDYARRWCWQNIGPENGPCSAWHSEYPACPLVVATAQRERVTWTDKSGKTLSRERTRCTNPGDHEHEGKWSFLWLGKTDYDYGYGEYYFEHNSDCENFLAVFSTFTWSEEWDKEDS